MAKHFKNCDDMPILALDEEGINYKKPFVLLRIINISGELGFKILFASSNVIEVQNTYYKLKNIAKEPLIIVNEYWHIIKTDKDIHEAIFNYCNETIEIVKILN